MIRLLPNAITGLRGAAGPLIMWLVLGPGLERAAFWVFLVAISSDMVDGWIARKLNATSAVALLLDPLADKVLTDFAWAALAVVGHAPLWLAAPIVLRDLIVGGVWWWGSRRGRRWPPRPLGQIGVAVEGIALCVLLFHGPWLGVHWPTVGAVLGSIGLALSLAQLLEYSGGAPRETS